METKETLLKSYGGTIMLENIEYYKFIFKKTEKIACAVFYTVRFDAPSGHPDHVVKDVELSATELLRLSLMSLRNTNASVAHTALDIKFALIALESKLRIACSARFVSPDVLDVFVHEIDSVQRTLKKYTESPIQNPLSEAHTESSRAFPERRVPRVGSAIVGAQSQSVQGGSMASRRERVISVIRDNVNATIKDISGIVTDCSEKTIQRELIQLIKDNVIMREGERRWSKYRLI